MDQSREVLKDHYPSNSKTQKAPAKEEKRVAKVVTGEVKQKKRSFGKRLSETFLEDDTTNVGTYILYDVLIPAAKALISEMITGSIDMLLFGERRGTRTQRQGGRSVVNYGGIFYSKGQPPAAGGRPQRDISRTARSRHDFDEIVLETRGEAEEVLSHLFDLTIDYGEATVADLYDLVGVTGDFPDTKFGWTDLRSASVSRTRGGYVINLPRTQQLD